MNIEQLVSAAAFEAVKNIYNVGDPALVQVQKTRKEFVGDYTLVVFPLLKYSSKSPDVTASEIGSYITDNNPDIGSFNVIKGFLNLSFTPAFWAARFSEMTALEKPENVQKNSDKTGEKRLNIMVEYSSPNTNKPLHLGHVRNNLLGYSVAEILRACGHNVLKANLVNDRGIHICKSMLAWQKFGGGETPESSGMKGDHLVGKYYVEFDRRYKAEVQSLIAAGKSDDEAKRSAPMMLEAGEMLRRWEARDPEVYALWETMNGWVYTGFDATYKRLGVDFDRMYYESQTYLLGKSLVEQGLEKGVFYRRDDGSVWCDLTADGLDEKLLLRADGTSVYMTQDLGTAYRRFEDENLDALIYVVGNEQNYHFQVLKLILSKLGFSWANNIFHLSYGMVELPNGKMKSREGTVVDADDLIEAMVETAREMSAELGKLDGMTPSQVSEITEMVGLGALKYFILKVDPRKTMLFDPRESIDFNGNTGPFIQYTHARIKSVLRKSEEANATPVRLCTAYVNDDVNRYAFTYAGIEILSEELELIKTLLEYSETVKTAGENYSPSIVAAYVYELAKMYNGYYHDHSILREENADVKNFRLHLSQQVAATIKRGMRLLGIDVPERM